MLTVTSCQATHQTLWVILGQILTLSVLTSFPADVYTDIMGFTAADMLGLLLSSRISAATKYTCINIKIIEVNCTSKHPH